MKRKLDARNMACPLPVIESKKILISMKEGESLEVLVDNHIAVQNLSKMAAQKNFPVTSEKIDENNYIVTFSIGETVIEDVNEEVPCYPDQKWDIVVVISSDKMGEGDEKLGRILMKGFIYALTELDVLPSTVLLYNGGAKLSVEDSESLQDLKTLEAMGVEILTCGTCLNFYGISEKLGVGTATNMYEIAEKQMKASKVVRP
jgi:selenium metabolism protein YedF